MSTMNYNNQQLQQQQQQPYQDSNQNVYNNPPQGSYNARGGYGGNMNSYGGNMNSYGGNMNSYGGNSNPYGGNMNSNGGNMNSTGSNMNYQGGNPNSYGNNMNPNSYGPVNTVPYSNCNPFYGSPYGFPFAPSMNPYLAANRNPFEGQGQNYFRRNTGGGNRRRGQQQKQQQQVSPQNRNRIGNSTRPRTPQLADYMPPQFRPISPALPQPSLTSEFELENVRDAFRPPTPANALPQRQNHTTTTATTTTENNTVDTTQPFVVQNTDCRDNIQQQQQQQQQQPQQKQTAAFRRRQRRNKQQQQQRTTNTVVNNRFAVFDDDTDLESVAELPSEEQPIEAVVNKKNKNKRSNQQKKKIPAYLETSRLLRWFQDNAFSIITGRHNQLYMLDSAPIYDSWVRNNYELQVWQQYLKLGTNEQQWAKEVVQKTKKRDNVINSRFVQKKIARFTAEIAKASAAISDLQRDLGDYFTQQVIQAAAATTNRSRETIDRLEKAILKYIHLCTQHVGQMAVNRVKLATSQLTEYKALKEFESVATPSQWNTHLILKPRMVTLATKHKNLRLAQKRVEYDLPPKVIPKINFSFRIDEKLLGSEDSQALYDDMRALTKEVQTRSMAIYLKASRREHEIIQEQVDAIIEGMPKLIDGDLDAIAGFTAFEEYHKLRKERQEIEIQQAILFLDEQRVEDDTNEQLIAAPTLTRSLGEDFLLRL